MTCDEMCWPKKYKAVDCNDAVLRIGDNVKTIVGTVTAGHIIEIREGNVILVEERVLDTKHKHGPKEWVYRWILPARQVKKEGNACGDVSEVIAKA